MISDRRRSRLLALVGCLLAVLLGVTVATTAFALVGLDNYAKQTRQLQQEQTASAKQSHVTQCDGARYLAETQVRLNAYDRVHDCPPAVLVPLMKP